MARTSPQGLTAQDFHHQPYVNPRDVFAPKSRLISRSQIYKSPIRNQTRSRSSSRFSQEQRKFACCGQDEDESTFPSSSALDCCVTFNHGNDDSSVNVDEASTSCCDEPHHSSPSPMDCEDCVDDCDDCVEEHLKANQRPCNYVDDCDECSEEEKKESLDRPACTDTCDECDFSCFDCVDWTEFEHDKDLGLSFSVPLLNDNSFSTSDVLGFETSSLVNPQPMDLVTAQPDPVAPPVDVPMHHQCFSDQVTYWNDFVRENFCNGNPGLSQQRPLPPFALNFGCHPAIAHQQMLQTPLQTTGVLNFPASSQPHSNVLPKTEPRKEPLNSTQDLLSAVSAPSTSHACQWVMPCGTVCGASFASGTDLKKHLKSVHLIKGVTKCQWQNCDSPEFASEAALTGHISKKHLAAILASAPSSSSLPPSSSTQPHKHKHTHAPSSGGPFKCTFPNCPKSFVYKHIRDEHVATHHGGNRMYCPICQVYLNGEGSNFKRHMATHRPKHQHMLCKYHGLGCKRRFPRLDNLRRHEACCKVGKKAKAEGKIVDGSVEANHHHHHHHVHVEA